MKIHLFNSCHKINKFWISKSLWANIYVYIYLFLSIYIHRKIIKASLHNQREDNHNPLQYSCLENPMDRGAWWGAGHGVTKSRARLNDFTFTFHFHALETEMAAHSSVLARRIPGTGEPGGLPSMGSRRVGHDWSDLAAAEWLDVHSCTKSKHYAGI